MKLSTEINKIVDYPWGDARFKELLIHKRAVEEKLPREHHAYLSMMHEWTQTILWQLCELRQAAGLGRRGEPVPDPVSPEWLKSVGIHAGEETPPEFQTRILGGSDDGWKESTDDDKPGDEVQYLVLTQETPEKWHVYVETCKCPDFETVEIVYLGPRSTRAEILELCRALKAWAINYPV